MRRSAWARFEVVTEALALVRLFPHVAKHRKKIVGQHVAGVSEQEFCDYLRKASQSGHEITATGLLRVHAKATARRTETSPTRNDRTPINSAASGPQESIAELKNHCQLLTNILRPIYETEQVELQRSERRIIGRLLSEMQQLLTELSSTW